MRFEHSKLQGSRSIFPDGLFEANRSDTVKFTASREEPGLLHALAPGRRLRGCPGLLALTRRDLRPHFYAKTYKDLSL